MILSLWVLLLTVCSWPQPSSTNRTESRWSQSGHNKGVTLTNGIIIEKGLR
jgi:hypothetical protein